MTGGYKGLPEVTRGDGVTRGDRGLHGVTGVYKG